MALPTRIGPGALPFKNPVYWSSALVFSLYVIALYNVYMNR